MSHIFYSASKPISCIFPKANNPLKKIMCMTVGGVGFCALSLGVLCTAEFVVSSISQCIKKQESKKETKKVENHKNDGSFNKTVALLATPHACYFGYSSMREGFLLYKTLKLETRCCPVVRRTIVLLLPVTACFICTFMAYTSITTCLYQCRMKKQETVAKLDLD
jgi:hypothetical protein